MGSLHRFDSARDPLAELRAVLVWVKSKDEDDFAGVKAAAEEAAENALKKVKARITRLKNEAKKQGGLADKVGVLQKIQDAERLQRTMRNEIFAVEDAIKSALSQKDASVMRDFSSTFPEAVAIVEKALSGVGGATAPEQSPATSENFIGADIYHEFFVENEYGSPGYDDGFHTIRKSAQPGTTVLEKIIRPSGKYIYVLYLIEADGYGQEVVNPGDQLFEVVKKIKEKYEAKQTQKQLVQEKRQKVDKTNQRVAQDEGFFVGKKIGSLYFNDGKKLKNAVIVGAKPNGIFDIEGTAGNRRMVAKGVEAEALLKAIDRAQGYDHSITPLGVQTTIGNAIQGRPNPVKTAKGTRIETVLALIEADSLIVSHDPASGAENPAFPQELQPRDRSRDSSQQWVQKVAANLDPDSLGRTSRADTGAPIIGPDNVVESGNGRSMAIKLAYQRGNADDYRQWLIHEADYFGLKPEQVEAMNQPVLVRLRTSDVDRKAFAVEANQDDKLSFTATERAKSDAKRLNDHLIGLFAPSEDGDFTAASNQRFLQAFLQSLGEAEAAQYLTKDGKPTASLIHRIRSAVFSKAYNDDRLLEMAADQSKPEIQNVLNALSSAAPRFIEAQGFSRTSTEEVASGMVDSIEQSLNQKVVDTIIKATNTLMASRASNQDIAEYVKQQGLFEDLPEGVPELAVFLARSGRSAKKMSIAFKAMADFVRDTTIQQRNASLFDEPELPKMTDVVAAANAAIEREYGPEEGGTIGLFDSAIPHPLHTLKSILTWAQTRDDGPDGKITADGRTYTFKIAKRGRKWFSGTVGKGYKAELFINGTTTGLKEGQEVKFMGQDLSVRNKYGTTIRYAATKIINEANARQVEWFRDAQKWLGYAESDAKEGKWFTNALQKAQSYRLLVPELAERIDELTRQSKEGVERLKAQKQQQDAAAQAFSEQAATPSSVHAVPASQRRKLFSERDRNRPSLNQPERLDNRVVVYTSKGKSFMIREDDMDFYRTEWDGTSGAYYYYREATAEEIRQLEQREAVEKADADAQRARRNAIAALKKRIETEGTTPRNEDGSQITIGGTRYLDTQNIYGSGDWFEVTDSAIWYVMNRGMDGDYWAANNVRTGGAGGIGSFIPYDPAIHEQLKEWDGKSDGGSNQENHVLDSIANAEGAWRVHPVAPVLGGAIGQMLDSATASPLQTLQAILSWLKPRDAAENGDEFSDRHTDENYRYKDVGYVPGSKKEQSQQRMAAAKKAGQMVTVNDIDWDELASDSRMAEHLITKANLMGKPDWEALRDDGMPGEVGYLIKRIYTMVSAKPPNKSIGSQKLYARGLQSLRDRMEACRNDEEIRYELKALSFEVQEGRRENHITLPDGELGLTDQCLLALVLGKKLKNWIFSTGNKALQDCHYGKGRDWAWLEPSDRPESGKKPKKTRPQLEAATDIQRMGPEVKVSSTAELQAMLGLRAVQSGNYVLKDKASAEFHIQRAAEAMQDMADVTGIPANLLGMGGRLALAFGARGRSGALAHYESVQRVINITKAKGGGSLGHEYFHALDNIMLDLVKQESGSASVFLSEQPNHLPEGKLKEAFLALNQALVNGTVRSMETFAIGRYAKKIALGFVQAGSELGEQVKAAGNVIDAIARVREHYAGRKGEERLLNQWLTHAVAYYSEDGQTEVTLPTGPYRTQFLNKSVLADEGDEGKYWSKPYEMAARAYSAYLQDRLAEQGRVSDYLAYSTQGGNGRAGEWAYPQGEERTAINAAFDRLFSAIREEQVLEKAVANKPLMDAIFGQTDWDESFSGATWLDGTLLKWSEISAGPKENRLPSADQIGAPVWVGIRDQGDKQVRGIIAGVRFSQSKVYYRVALQIQNSEWAAVIECPSEFVETADKAALDSLEEDAQHVCGLLNQVEPV